MHLNNGGCAYDGFSRYSGVSLYCDITKTDIRMLTLILKSLLYYFKKPHSILTQHILIRAYFCTFADKRKGCSKCQNKYSHYFLFWEKSKQLKKFIRVEQSSFWFTSHTIYYIVMAAPHLVQK